MKNYNKKLTDTDICVNCRFSYASLYRPRSIEGSTPKYQLTLLIDKDDTQAVKLVRDAEEAAKKLFVEKFGKVTGKLKSVVYDGDVDFPDDANCENKLVVRSSSPKKPDLYIIDSGLRCVSEFEDDIYSGCYGAVEINFYPYSGAGSKGVTAGLNQVLKVEDGERLGGSRRSADDVFGVE